MNKKILSVVSLVLVFMMLVACGGGNEAPESTAPESTAPESTAPESTAPEAPTTDWPTKPITVIVPAGAGGDTDLNFRIFAKYLQEELGQTIVVTNIKGVAVALDEFAKSANDGYTAYVHHPGLFCATLLGTTEHAYTDFETVGIYCMDKQSAWFVSNDSPYQDLNDLAEAAKQAPIGYATEVGSMSHLCCLAMMNLAEGAQFNIVDAGGAADKITALMSGQLDLMFNQVGLVKDYLKNGDFRCLGIMAEERSELNPDIPTFKEQGFDMVFDKPFWFMFPADTDQAIVDKCAEAFQAVFANEEYGKELAETMQTFPGDMTPEESMEYLDAMNTQYAELLKGLQG
ncbi:MAG: tripartite tricarboxylate transporter substrate binding protein [Candidatus Heteroscillospira sp.]|jgi:tripartite-type tricarboxylate transporter receptor subunit TctC